MTRAGRDVPARQINCSARAQKCNTKIPHTLFP